MIRINLLRESGKKTIQPRRGRGKVILVAGIVAVVVATGGALWKFHPVLFPGPAAPQKQEYTVKKDAAPSTYAKKYIVEEVVKEVSDARQRLSTDGMLSLSYEDLSFSEKISYEALFAKNIVELLGKAVPIGIGLRSLEIDNFQTLYAMGMAPSRDLVEKVFVTLKNEKVDLLPKPLTIITPNGRNGFKFAFTGKTEFGLNLTDPFVGAVLLSNSDLPRALSAFERIAKENSISIKKGLSMISAEKVGAYYRHQYRWSGTGSYKNFIKLVLQLYQTKQFCAFKRISINALSSSSVSVESQIIVTTRE
jgi:hypothetical protein